MTYGSYDESKFFQVDSAGQEQLLSCYSKMLRPNERKWHIQELEALSLLTAFKHNRHLLIGRQTIVKTDNKTVQFLKGLKLKSPSSLRLIRWAIANSDILDNVEFEYIKSADNVVPDALSRQNFDKAPVISAEDEDWIDEGELLALICDGCDYDGDEIELCDSNWPTAGEFGLFHTFDNDSFCTDDFIEQSGKHIDFVIIITIPKILVRTNSIDLWISTRRYVN